MKQYSQYFTNNIYSKLLIQCIEISNPKLILDLGIGDGALTKIAIKRWNSAKILAVDLDKEKCDLMKNLSDRVTIIQEDALIPNLKKRIKINIGSVDVAICNPPYQQTPNNEKLFSVFRSSFLPSCCKLKRISSDIIFLAHNLSLLKPNGYLGIILPDGVLTRKDFTNLRKDIISNHTVKHIIQLPEGVFDRTEACTHILILTKGRSDYQNVTLSLVDSKGNYTHQIQVQKNNLIDRMDFTFHLWKQEHKEYIIPDNIEGIEVCRGSYSHKELKQLHNNYFHSTDFKGQNKHSFSFHDYELDKNKIIATRGDILMCRVGKRCVGKISIVEEGNIILSDCVYRIRVHEPYQKIVWRILNSKEGQEWIKVASHGVCSKVISKCDLVEYIKYIIKKYRNE